MQKPHLFNPYIVDTRHGTIHSQAKLHERMCMWYELELIPESSEDSGVITLDNFIPLKAGTLMFRKPGDIVKGIAPVSYSYIAIIFDTIFDQAMKPYYDMGDDCSGDAIGKEFFDAFYRIDRDFSFINEIPSVLEIEDFNLIYDMMLECSRLCENKPKNYQIMAKALLLQILIRIHRAVGLNDQQNLTPSKSSAVVRIIEYMRNNYMKPITLDTIAQQVSMSREYICRLFKSDTGMPPMAYLQHIRIFNAKSMLLTTSLTIEEIAAACGYENVNYFYSVFKKACGMTPSQYRK